MPLKFGDFRDSSRASFRIRGNPDLEAGNVRENASLDVTIDSATAADDSPSRIVSDSPIRVFLSYRRADSPGYAGRLRDDILRLLPNATVFLDVQTLEAGTLFQSAIEASIQKADAVLVVIGDRWLEPAQGDLQARLFDPNDLVRSEIRWAIERAGLVVPVLVQGASMPARALLPEDLQPLCDRHAVELSEVSWQQDTERLVRHLVG